MPLQSKVYIRLESKPQVQVEEKRSAVSRGPPRLLPTAAVLHEAAVRTVACRWALRLLDTCQREYTRRRRLAPTTAKQPFVTHRCKFRFGHEADRHKRSLTGNPTHGFG